ncbi:MAG TPA: hypothetical protein VGI81_17195 [Tepidisphaeraceae bacterium]|jgi:probable HAF family extracellular repeat protein
MYSSALVVGYSEVAGSSLTHAFLFNGTGGLQDLGTLGGTDTRAYGINSAGEVVGISSTSGNVASHGFLYADGTLVDLNIITNAPGYVILGAVSINSSGQIAGTALSPSGVSHAIILTPTAVPSPAAAWMGLSTTALGVAALGMRRRRNRGRCHRG